MREKLPIGKRFQGWVWQARDSFVLAGARPPHTHQELELNLVLAGQGRYLVSGVQYDLTPGTLIWLFPRQPHVLAHVSDDFNMMLAVFRPVLVSRVCQSGTAACLRKRRPKSVLSRTLDAPATERLRSLCEAVITAIEEPAWFNSGLAFLLRYSWAAYESTQDTPPCKAVHPAVDRAARHLSQETDALSLPELARQCGLSYSRLCRLFGKQVGMSLLEFRNRRRLDHFRQLYGKGRQRTLLDCALEAGFGSYAQFHRVFKKHLKISPRDCRA